MMTDRLVVAIQMDPIARIDIDGDSTFALALEAQARGYELLEYGPGDLSFSDRRLRARARPLQLRPVKGDHYSHGAPVTTDLGEADVILMRQDPPFDMGYITATHLLEHIHPETLVVNDPVQVRNAPEKLFATYFPEFMPATLITSDIAEIGAFRAAHGDIIVKPLHGNGGAGIFHLGPDSDNLNALMEVFATLYRGPAMVQEYLPQVRDGDKRIILVEGEPVGALNRIPAEGEARSNLHVGGRAAPAALDPRDLEICAALGPELKRRGLIFVGIDVIGGYLTEINVTSPTGLREIARFDGTNIAALIWDAIEARLAAGPGGP